MAPIVLVMLAAAQVEPTWSDAEPRTFFASAIDVGFLYLRPRASIGYGQPHWQWIGMDANPIIGSSGLGFYSGLRLAIPHFDVRAGARAFYSFQHSFLVPHDHFSRLDSEDRSQPTSRYVTLEAEATLRFRVGWGDLVAVLTGSAVTLTPAGYDVFEETLRVITKPPFIWRGRFAYAFVLGPLDAVSVGPVIEVVGLPRRDALVLRGGVSAHVWLTDDMEAIATFVPVITSPDSIGLDGADFAQLGIRWRWATGM
jgi:hypothetical protein